MIALLVTILVYAASGEPLKHAFVQCAGYQMWGELPNGTPGWIDEDGIAQTETRGATIWEVPRPEEMSCLVWKDGYLSSTRRFAVDEKHTRFTVTLQKKD